MKKARRIFKGLSEEQVSHLLQDSIVLVLLDKWSPIKGRGYTVAELFPVWAKVLDNEGLVLPFKNVRGLGMHLGNIKGALKKRYGITTGTAHRTLVYYFPVAKTELSPEEERATVEKEKNHKKQVDLFLLVCYVQIHPGESLRLCLLC
ncbi:unnamed protein product [marine sediment metagenome]|uniref:Uncharacterized protein n=1 Tax=marine sediment metagenome TaxID=412755 RepID=X1U2W7_9ZZZZ